MSAEGEEFEGELVNRFLRFLRGRGPRPDIDRIPEDQRRDIENLLKLLEAIADTDEISRPALEDDPLAIRLGLVPGPHGGNNAPSGGIVHVEREGDPIDAALAELAHRLPGEFEILHDQGNGNRSFSVNGFLPARAVCRTLGEVIVVSTTDQDDFSELPRRVAPVFLARPTATAVAVVASVSLLTAVLTEADCVRAIDPIDGWIDPALPRAPEPIGLALGRYLESSLPRWDEVARLDEMLLLTDAAPEISRSVATAVEDNLRRHPRIPAKRSAIEALSGLTSSAIEDLVNEVRAGRLVGEQLIERLRALSQVYRP